MGVWECGSFGVRIRPHLHAPVLPKVKKPIASSVLAVFIGAIAIALLDLVPCLGALVLFVLALLGFGAVLITGFGADPEWIWNRKRSNPPPVTSAQGP